MIPHLELIADGFNRLATELPTLLEGLTTEQLMWQPSPTANHIAWLAWHIARDEDAQMAVIAHRTEVYLDGWVERFALPYEPTEMGYGQTIEQVRAFTPPTVELLVDHYLAVAARTSEILSSLSTGDLISIIDDPYRVTVATRLVSILNDGHQHLGQVAYLRGLLG